ncbi:MAG: hypothetical protein AB1633_00170, partial [Elusimicrobiota bacterium]
KGDFNTAFSEFDVFSRDYSYSDLLVSSKYKMALCAMELKKNSIAKNIFDEIMKKYPRSPEAEQSKEKLKALP